MRPHGSRHPSGKKHRGDVVLKRLILIALCVASLVVPSAFSAAPAWATVSPPHISTSFGASPILLNADTSLSFAIYNPNLGTDLTNVGFTDTLPSIIEVSSPNSLSNTCGGVVTATPGSSSVSLSGAPLTGGTVCAISVQVTGVSAGVSDNSVTVTSSAGTGNTATASLTVLAPPESGVTFCSPYGGPCPSWLPVGGTIILDLAVLNPNTTTALSGVGFTDTLPKGFVIAKPNGLSTWCSSGTIKAAPGTREVSLANASLTPGPSDPNSACEFEINVKATKNGYWTNSTGPVTSTEAGTGAPSEASFPVFGPGPLLFWDNFAAYGGSIDLARLDGTVGSHLQTPPVCGTSGLTIDSRTDRIYWLESQWKSAIEYHALGGNANGILDATGAAGAPFGQLTIDPHARRLYWTAALFDKLDQAALDGSGGGPLSTTGATVSGPIGLALDRAHGRIYWTNTSANSISYAALNGSGGADLSITGTTPNEPQGLALDPESGHLYWANGGNNTLAEANPDGSAGATLDTTGAPVSSPAGVAVDPVAGRIYWANTVDDSIGYANLDGSGSGGSFTAAGGTLSDPYFLAIMYPPASKKDPRIRGGTTVGSKLTCSLGSWAPDVPSDSFFRAPSSYSFGWSLDGKSIKGVTSSKLRARTAGSYSCTVTASNFAGTTSRASAKHAVG